ncbi:TetR family transcriptional regulator C-terminal domain-containing protein [Nocardia terpenica]|uniref:TetR/AcrR family transcriptional regulator n=1 Tax=Nocardia terpenica TaxID=455432 RepID=UPI00189419B7|nr:TetR/AcrR family transcriptional regulator [Nocardia terpenica]MBF6060442.1 TetR family transcriptional regulator C-terminal domain-containing protein [Nocardia terpenica]MBF6103702.1 TetR family transcriptional regulator C-terminal domain-containing protein [Nocardia terpenica]MBF6111924.1 TetR family transcriptional regulator C-terminal domain-containing protein [Nocardia terpenica]MBF6117923.1 TetR family transcriptional regulator C-terminal domain-containing protein [Nocardia terpenica]
MPKLVDRDSRRREVVDALFRVAVRDGLHRASLRAVADEAGLNIGSVRHYFADQRELMRFAMQTMLDRVDDRLQRRIDEAGDPSAFGPARLRHLAADLLAELLPLDETRRAEAAVFIDFITAARTNPAIGGDLAHQAAVGTRTLVRRILVRMTESAAPRLDLDTETERLTSLLDGLSLNAILHPDLIDPGECIKVLQAHLDQLAD